MASAAESKKSKHHMEIHSAALFLTLADDGLVDIHIVFSTPRSRLACTEIFIISCNLALCLTLYVVGSHVLPIVKITTHHRRAGSWKAQT